MSYVESNAGKFALMPLPASGLTENIIPLEPELSM